MSNLTAKGGINLRDKILDDGITDVMPSLEGILAGSSGPVRIDAT